MPADRKQLESHANHLRSAGTIDDRVELAASGGPAQLLANVLGRFAPGADDVIGPVLPRDREFVWMTRQRDDRRARAQELRVLHGISAQAADAEHGEDPVW